MATAVGAVLEEARELHPGFAPTWVPEPLAIRMLGRYQRALASKIAILNPDALKEIETVSLPLSPFSDGHSLPAAHRWARGRALSSTGSLKEPLHLISEESVPYSRLFPAAFIRAGTLFLVGQASDWTAYGSLEIPYVPIPDLLTEPADEFVLPDSAHPTLVAALADYMAGRVSGIKDAPKVDVGRYRADRDEAQRDFLKEVTTQRQARENLTEERW